AEAERRSRALAAAFRQLGLGPDRPLMILSGNSLEHFVVSLGAYAAQVPVMPISVAYSLMSADHARIRAIAELTDPGLVFADDAGPFGGALDSLAPTVAQALVAYGEREGALRLDDLLAGAPGDPMGPAGEPEAEPGPDTVAKLLFTSGSTGVPKGVVNTHRMLCANQAMLQAIWPFLADEPPVMVDWLPWSHTFGANHNLNLALFNGGTIHIDDGKPAPALFGRTVAALRDVPPTLYFNVPAGYALLAPALENDPHLAERFFSRLRFMFYAAAALPDALAARLRTLAAQHADHEVPLTSSWGTTETAPCATSMHYLGAPTGCIGVPIPGCTIKLAPVADRLEIRVKGPNVTPGYFHRPDLTETAFDEDGFYRSGDAVLALDAQDPNQGMLFDGRIAENFKVLTGTWVAAGALRTRLISVAGVLADAVICGQDAEYVAAMAWVNQAEARRLTGAGEDVALDDATLRAHLADALRTLNGQAGSASRIERLLLLAQPPSLDAGEITDKGYLNQRRTLECRAADVTRLYAEPADPAVISGSGA
ncbi:MAG TPA: AMP-binding protein, partial [Solirubrobacteraceae bacterium]|nr:AMP-binding protein [Solirubrobacteraceae bacterium]